MILLGKNKCMAKTGDCCVKHPAGFASGMALVVSSNCCHFDYLFIEFVC